MCGVFGYVSEDGKPVSLPTLRRIARACEARGEHAWGLAWINRAGRLCMYKQTGAITDSLALLGMARDATVLIGHTRYATQGDPRDNQNNHPHPCDGGWLVHNGMLPDYRELVAHYDLHPVTDCDSEVLALLMERMPGRLLERAVATVDLACTGPLTMLGLWKPGRLVVARAGNPLHVGQTKGGLYLASVADGLPGKVKPFPDHRVTIYGEAL